MASQTRKPKKVGEPKARIISHEEARQWFEDEAQRLFGMSGDEWVRRYDAGEYDAIFDTHDVLELYFMLPMYRDVPVNGRG